MLSSLVVRDNKLSRKLDKERKLERFKEKIDEEEDFTRSYLFVVFPHLNCSLGLLTTPRSD
jgi:hypothetical protein